MIARVLAAFRLLGLANAGTPLLIASTPVRAVQPEANARIASRTRPSPANVPVACTGRSADSARTVSPVASAHRREREHDVDAGDEAVGGDREGAARSRTPRRFIRVSSATNPTDSATAWSAEGGSGGGDRGDPGHDRHRDGQHVVHEQRAGGGQRGVPPEVLGADLVGPAAVRDTRGRSGGRTRRPRSAATRCRPPTYQVQWSRESPPRRRISRISSVAYATEESGSLQKIGRASRLGSRVSPIPVVGSGRPDQQPLRPEELAHRRINYGPPGRGRGRLAGPRRIAAAARRPLRGGCRTPRGCEPIGYGTRPPRCRSRSRGRPREST